MISGTGLLLVSENLSGGIFNLLFALLEQSHNAQCFRIRDSLWSGFAKSVWTLDIITGTGEMPV
jgi:hypothetical protein